MSNITELIKNIRNAIFGKDVRESIAKAIEQCYEEASKSGNANMEVSEARGSYDTLKKRLDNSDNAKADKTTTANLQSQINSLASGSPIVATSISEMVDTTKVYVNTTDGHWYWNNGNSWIDGGTYQATEDSKTVDNLVKSKEDKINIKNEVSQSLISNNTFIEYQFVTGHVYYFYNTSESTQLSAQTRLENRTTFVENIIGNISAGQVVKYNCTKDASILLVSTGDMNLDNCSFKIVDITTSTEQLNDLINKTDSFSINNLSKLAQKFINGYNLRTYKKHIGKVSFVLNNQVVIQDTATVTCFTVSIPLKDFTNNLNITLSFDDFICPISRIYYVKEDGSFTGGSWNNINSDNVLYLSKSDLDQYKADGYINLIISIANTSDFTFANGLALPLYCDFYTYEINSNNLITVNKDGTADYLTIQEAIDNAKNWDTVLIMPRNL